jgi:hypothetical protein
MDLGLTRLEILLTTALLCALIGLVYVAFLQPEGCPARLGATIKACNEIITVTQANCAIEAAKEAGKQPLWNLSIRTSHSP